MINDRALHKFTLIVICFVYRPEAMAKTIEEKIKEFVRTHIIHKFRVPKILVTKLLKASSKYRIWKEKDYDQTIA